MKKHYIIILLSLAAFFAILTGCKTLENASLQSGPFKNIYGQGEDLDLTGIVVMGTYSDGSYKQVPVSPASVSGYDKHRTGVQNLAVNLGNNSLFFSVEVKPLTALKVIRPPTKTLYRQGENLDLAGILVMASWDGLGDGPFPLNSLSVSPFNPESPGRQIVRLSAEGLSAEVEVQVKPLLNLALTKLPKKTLYKRGENLDLTGLELTGIWEEIGSSIIPLQLVSISEFDKNTIGNQSIVLSYGGKSVSFSVSLRPLQSITVTKAPVKTVYKEGEDLDLTGIELTGIWEGIGNSFIKVDPSSVIGFDKTRAGTQTLTITVESRTATFTVNVIGISYIQIQSLPDKRVYAPGESLDLAGMTVLGVYTDNTDVVIPPQQLTINRFDSNRLGEQTLVVSFSGRTASFTVTVTQPSIK